MKTIKLKFSGLLFAVLLISLSCAKNDPKPAAEPAPATPAKKPCELNGTGIIGFTNKTGYELKISLDNGYPSGFESVSAGETVSVTTTSGIMHKFKAVSAQGNLTGSWSGDVSVGTCLEAFSDLTM